MVTYNTHKLSSTKLYKRWARIKARCYNPNRKDYKHYGSRGIGMCSEWKDNFVAFYTWAMNNGYSEELDLDRKDNDKDYSPDNCRWVTRTENNRNKRNNKLISIKGETKTLAEWAEIIGVDRMALKGRIQRGWTDSEIFKDTSSTKPIDITINGETKTIREWAEITGIGLHTLRSRVRRGYPEARLLEPTKKTGLGAVKK